jgi:hypothetical protein
MQQPGILQPGILQPAEADSQSIGRRRFTETAHYMYCWTLLPAIVPDGGPVDLEIEKKVKQLDCLSPLRFALRGPAASVPIPRPTAGRRRAGG